MRQATKGIAAFAVLLAVAAPSSAQASVHRALLVGIEKYPPATGWPVLRGCDADVASMRTVLAERAGFRDENIKVLLDPQATHAAIVDAFRALAGQCGPDDLLLFYFAGHGSQLPDDDGDEADGLDETLVPFDAVRPDGSPNDIRDDELGTLIAMANECTSHVQLVLDSCSSGTASRGEENGPACRFVPLERRGLKGVRAGVSAEAGSGWYGPSLACVAFSACRSIESAHEHVVPAAGGEPEETHGLFTWCLLQELNAQRRPVSCGELLDAVRDRVQRVQRDQMPTLEGARRDESALGESAEWTQSWVGTLAPDGTLRAGLVSGLQTGAVLAVQPAGAPRDDPSTRLGRVRVAGAGAVSSWLEWIDGPSAGADLSGARCFELELGEAPESARLAVCCPADSSLAKCVDGSHLLRLAPESDAALRVVEEAGQLVVRRPGRASTLLAVPLDTADPVLDLFGKLEHLGRAHRIGELVRHESSPLLRAEAVIEHVDTDGHPTGPLERDDAGRLVVHKGDGLGTRVHNLSDGPVWASLVVISPDGEVGVFQPGSDAEAIPSGGWSRADLIDAKGKVVNIRPFTETVHDRATPFFEDAPDCYRWILTTRPPDDLSDLIQGSVCELVKTRGGPAAGPARRPEAPPDDWITVSLDVYVQPK